MKHAFRLSVVSVVAAALVIGAAVVAFRLVSGATQAEAGEDPAAPRISPQQQAALADGVITEAEYLAAINAHLSCVEQRVPGVTAVRPGDPSLGRGAQWGYTVPPDKTGASEAAQEACEDEFSRAVQRKYAESRMLEPEAYQAQRRQVAACVAAKGYQLGDTFPQGDIDRLLASEAGAAALEACFAQASTR